jgi:hypothetical protein
VQPDRTLLVVASAEVERSAAEVHRHRADLRPPDDLAPTVLQLEGNYPTGVIVPKHEMKELSKRLERSESLGKYDTLIRPLTPKSR